MNSFSFYTGLLLFLFYQSSYSQIIVKDPDPVTSWEKINELGLDVTQIAFVNWSIGGNSSISGLFRGKIGRKYEIDNLTWNNEMLVRFGINKQDGRELRKTDDAFQINSTLGYRNDTSSNWYHSAKFNFLTQFTDGYAYPNTSLAISKLFAPAYIFLGIGAEYIDRNNNLNFYLSPLTEKTTLVFNERLANQGSFGVTKAIYDDEGNLLKSGKRSRTEVGILVTNYWKKEVYKDIIYENRLSLYTDYFNNFGNIDIDWQAQLDLVVNEYVKANIGLHIMYDDDVKFKKEQDGQQIMLGPRVQLKQMLGVGVVYVF